jgi:putative endonuclease
LPSRGLLPRHGRACPGHPDYGRTVSGITGTRRYRAGPVMTKQGAIACAPHVIRTKFNMRQYYLYILASRPGGSLYVGVTRNLIKRVYEHKDDFVEGHTKRYKIHDLVYFEIYSTAYDAIQREKNIKHWPRVWKTRLIAKENPTWRDLYDEIAS